MATKIIVTFAKRRRDDREVYRQAVLTVPLQNGQPGFWGTVAAHAPQLREDPRERIVSLSEAGYH